jgi:hypothetical protein
LPGFNVEDVTLSGIRIDSEEAGKEEWVSREVPEVPKAYPEARMFGRLPSFGFYCRHVEGLHMRNISIRAPHGEARPALVCDDVQGLELSGLETVATQNSQPVVKLVQTRGAWLRGCSAPVGTRVFLRVEGERTERVAMTGCDLSGAAKAVETSPNTSATAVSLGANLGA